MRRRGLAAEMQLGTLVAWLGLGCSHHLTLTPDAGPHSAPKAPLGVPLVLDFVDATSGGIPQSVDDSLTNRVAMDLRQTGVFAQVIEPIDAHHAAPGAVRLSVALHTVEDPHSLSNNAKAFVTGLSLFVLAPVFRYDHDIELRAEALLRTCDGWSKRYDSRVSGSLRTGLFTSESHSEATLRRGVLERALGPLFAQLSADDELRTRVTGLTQSAELPASCTGSAAR